MTKNKIPKFKSHTQEAVFWDSHYATDYFDPKQKVVLNFSKAQNKKESILTVRLQPLLKVKLNSIAQDMGTQSSTLARMWLMEKLKTMGVI
ncbi:MAG: CopG family antitoxin [Patescibacteria group bacterium]